MTLHSSLYIRQRLFVYLRVLLLQKSIKEAKEIAQYTYGGAGGERMYSSYSFTTSVLDGVSGQRHAPAALYPRGNEPRYPLYRRLGGPQSRSGHRG
jgi:hypothetical protein